MARRRIRPPPLPPKAGEERFVTPQDLISSQLPHNALAWDAPILDANLESETDDIPSRERTPAGGVHMSVKEHDALLHAQQEANGRRVGDLLAADELDAHAQHLDAIAETLQRQARDLRARAMFLRR